MSGYLKRALIRFVHDMRKCLQYSTFATPKPVFGQTKQIKSLPDSCAPLHSVGIDNIQKIISVLLYHAHNLNSLLFAALNTLITEQASTTESTIISLAQLLDYCATQPNTTLQFVASAMVLRIHSDMSYLSVSKTHS